jgi:hypothetical protein
MMTKIIQAILYLHRSIRNMCLKGGLEEETKEGGKKEKKDSK